MLIQFFDLRFLCYDQPVYNVNDLPALNTAALRVLSPEELNKGSGTMNFPAISGVLGFG